jgi:hypothetical protein
VTCVCIYTTATWRLGDRWNCWLMIDLVCGICNSYTIPTFEISQFSFFIFSIFYFLFFKLFFWTFFWFTISSAISKPCGLVILLNDLMTDRQTGRQAEWQTDRMTDRQTISPTASCYRCAGFFLIFTSAQHEWKLKEKILTSENSSLIFEKSGELWVNCEENKSRQHDTFVWMWLLGGGVIND